MTTNRQGIYASICIILFAIVMGFLHFMVKGFNEQFGGGFALGALFGAGLVFLASRRARHTF